MFIHLKNYAKNFKFGNLYTIAARPIMGKTTIARHIANILTENGQKGLYIDSKGILVKGNLKRPDEKYDYLCRRLISVEEVRNITFIGKYKIVVVDGFQDMYHKRKEDTAYKLKRLAEELNVVVIVLSHISRKADIRKNHQPRISDMTRKMCGSLWKSSDGVLFLWREAYYELNITKDIMNFIIAKGINDNLAQFQIDFIKLKEIWSDKDY